MFKSLLLAAAISSVAVAAQAADPLLSAREVQTSVLVPTAGVNFDNPRQVQALYQLLSERAGQACDSRIARDLAVRVSDAACARHALANAVAAAHRPMLTDVHEASIRGPIELTQR